MADPSTIFGSIEVVMKAAGGNGEPTAPGGGKGKPPPPPSLEIGKRLGGAAKAVAGKIPGAGAAKAAVGKLPKPDPKLMSMAGESLKHGAATAKGAGKTVGIQAGIASILKQSQLFTGVIGTIFQIVGMLVDVIIMPFMPIIIPVIKMLAWTVPKLMWVAMKVQTGIQAVVDVIGWIFTSIGEGIGYVFGGSWLKPLGEGIWSAIMSVWNAVTWWSGPLHPFKGFFEIIKGIISTIIDIIKSAWGIAKVIIQGIWAIIKLIFSAYKAIFKLYFEVIKAVINAYITVFKTAWGIAKSVIEGIWGFIQTAYSGIKEFISGVFDGAKAFFSGLWAPFKSGLDSAIEFVRGIPATIWGYIQSIWDTIKGWASTFVDALIVVKNWTVGIFQKVKDFFNGVWKTAKEWFTTARQWVWDKITDFATGFVNAIITVKDWTTGIFSKIKDFFNSVWDTAKNWFFTAKENIKDFFSSVWSTAKNWFLDRITSVKNFFTGIWNKASELITFLKEIGSKIFNKIDTIRQKILDILSTINPLNWIPQIVQKIKDIIPSPGDLVDAVPGVGAVKDVASKLKFWQHGGIVTRPTLGIAGEHGPEAIIPLRNLTRQSMPSSAPVNITVINRTPEGKESQEVFMVTRHQERNQNFEFEIQQHPLLGAGGL